MALGDGSGWDETTPTDATTATSIDDYNRDLRLGTRGRMAVEHEWPSSQTATSEAGKHKFITFQTQGAAPTLAGTQDGSVYLGTDNVVRVETSLGAAMPVPSIVQIVHTQDGAVDTGTTLIPMDDTIPQITEGDEYITRAITPTVTTNKLKIEIVIMCGTSANGQMTAALFQDTTADALACASHYLLANVADVITFTHYMDAGTTSATTFRVRVGQNNSGTTTFNGWGSARKMGGVYASSITITEIGV